MPRTKHYSLSWGGAGVQLIEGFNVRVSSTWIKEAASILVGTAPRTRTCLFRVRDVDTPTLGSNFRFVTKKINIFTPFT